MVDPELIFLHRDCKGSGRWLEPALERIGRMSHRFDGNDEGLVTTVCKLHAEKSPALGLWVGVHEDRIVGHALAQIQQYDGRWVVWLTQVEADVPVGSAYRDRVLAAIEEWAAQFNASFKAQGIHVTEMLMSTPRMTSAWPRHSGFEPLRVIHRRPMRFA